MQSEEEGLQNKQEEAANPQDPAGQEAAGLVVPVQNGEGDSLNLSAGFIQVDLKVNRCLKISSLCCSTFVYIFRINKAHIHIVSTPTMSHAKPIVLRI